ncbi:hypothetical protein JQC67_00450 [Aurantibacter crassamenti]|uniref:hypothetical protein n=1 Tax=Aurantibacter crassamenti TaxID=1837375 RepID=UPI00193959BD|nr:hypothetical protein [Aurantibacter crassamenti]MBM1104594.1 hypothetical protein [Aurantibacter crassamenti]
MIRTIFILLIFNHFVLNAQQKYPQSIENEAEKALSYYPELENTAITFKFKNKIKKSTMQAQPVFGSLFKSKKKRKYVILISERFKIEDTVYSTKDIPSDVLIGWLGHELGHVMDYEQRSSLNLIGFGIGYSFSMKYLKNAERTADTYAVNHGMESYIIATKNFILNEAGIPETYKNRIKKYYLSPEEIMLLVEDRNATEASNDL